MILRTGPRTGQLDVLMKIFSEMHRRHNVGEVLPLGAGSLAIQHLVPGQLPALRGGARTVAAELCSVPACQIHELTPPRLLPTAPCLVQRSPGRA